jgi:hypothetical protein
MLSGEDETGAPPPSTVKHRRLALITFLLLASTIGAALALTLPADRSGPSDADKESNMSTETARPSASKDSEGQDPIRPVLDKLRDERTEVTITVLGDSTGDADDEWVAQLADGIAVKYERTVVYSAWDIGTSTYGAPQTFGNHQAVPPVYIWNGSAAGQGPFYSQTHLPTMAPQPSDLIIISHGHNFSDPAGGAAKEVQLASLASSQWDNSPQIVVVLQNARITRAAVHETSMTSLSAAFAGTSYVLVDVGAAFRAEPDLASLLLPDGVHPNAAGQTLWLQTITDALGL